MCRIWEGEEVKSIAALLIALVTLSAQADTLTGRVVGVTDGDTVTVLVVDNKQYKVRLAGIDCPEKGQPYGQAAKQSLSDQVFDRQVSVESEKRDRYGRAVGKVWVDGRDANLEQLRKGLAWHYKKYENEQPLEDRLAYRAAEDEARASKRGLWADPAPVAPWDWRHKAR